MDLVITPAKMKVAKICAYESILDARSNQASFPLHPNRGSNGQFYTTTLTVRATKVGS
jgi:hypothetical protein